MIALIILAASVFAAALSSVIICSVSINTTEYTVPIKGVNDDVKLVCISDLHGWEYGKNNKKLIGLIAAQQPDAIIIAGDMITRRAREKQICRMLRVIKCLNEIAPIYYATGNHEADYMAVNGMDLLERVSETGAVVLYDSAADATVNGNHVRIGAASGRYFDSSERDKVTLKMLEEIGNDGIPSIAVVHQPENILLQEDSVNWTADIYLSGHTHGGVWCIPGIGGIMAPTQGLFPKYDKGKFVINKEKPLIINAGLSGYYFIPRMFNKPEICVIFIESK